MARGLRRGSRPLTPEDRRAWSALAQSLDHQLKTNGKQEIIDDLDLFPIAPTRAKPGGKHTENNKKPSINQIHTPQLLDKRTKQGLTRGRAAMEARLDLHGHTQAQAHDALIRFINHCVDRNYRFVIVITGKGRLSEAPGGVLRRLVPDWLRMPPLARHIVAFDWAGPRDGGDGALYVQLRRRRPSNR